MYKSETMMRLNLLMTPKQRERERQKMEEEVAKRREREEAQKAKEREQAAENARKEALERGEDVETLPPKEPDPPPEPKEVNKGFKTEQSPSRTWRSYLPFFFTLSHSQLMAAHRPLSQVKALERGAQTFSELFIFGVAAALILAETYRGSRNRRKEKNAAEQRLDELTEVVRLLASQLDQLEAHRSQHQTVAMRLANALSGDAPPSDRRPLFDFDALVTEAKRRVAIAEAEAEAAESQKEEKGTFARNLSGALPAYPGQEGEETSQKSKPASQSADDANTGSDSPLSPRLAAASPLELMEVENESLRATVAALLRLALKNGLMENDLGLQPSNTKLTNQRAPLVQVEGSTPAPVFPLTSTNATKDEDVATQIDRIADARARAIVREVRSDMAGLSSAGSDQPSTLASLLAQANRK